MMSVGEAIQSGHYCKEHNTKFYKNEYPKGSSRKNGEKIDQNGDVSIWYSHKKSDGTGFCLEKDGKVTTLATTAKNSNGVLVKQPNSYQSMYACNAMNNAVNLAANGAIGVDQIGQYFQKIYSELSKASV